MKRSIVDVNTPQHYRDSSLSSLESLISNCSEARTTIFETLNLDTINNIEEQNQFHSYEEISCTFTNMQDEYNSSTKQPTPGRPKMARVLATSSPEITALCRKSFPLPSGIVSSESFDRDNDNKDENLYNLSSKQYDPYTFSSDSSNFSMSSSSMESHSYPPPPNHPSSTSVSTWEPPPSITPLNKKATAVWMKSASGNTTARTAASTITGVRSKKKCGIPPSPKPLYVNIGAPSNDDNDGLNYGSDWELEEALSKSLNNMQLFHPEPWRRDSLSSLNSAPTPRTPVTTSGGVQRPTLHRRISFDQLPTPEMIMNEPMPVNTTSTTLHPSMLLRSTSDRPHMVPLHISGSIGSAGKRQHRRNTTQLIVQSPAKAVF